MKWLKINCFLCDDSGSPIPGSRKLFQVHGSFTLRMFLDQALPAMKFECDRIHTIQHVHNDDFSTFLVFGFNKDGVTLYLRGIFNLLKCCFRNACLKQHFQPQQRTVL